MLDKLQKVLDEAHRNHTYVRDIDQYGLPEHWQKALVGDCEDFALWCRDKLAEQGIDSLLIFCFVETGGGHLVCAVDNYVLDNRRKWVTEKDQLPYTWISAGDSTGTWRKIIS